MVVEFSHIAGPAEPPASPASSLPGIGLRLAEDLLRMGVGAQAHGHVSEPLQTLPPALIPLVTVPVVLELMELSR